MAREGRPLGVMASPILVIGNKVYSSWSLRPWVYMKHHGLPFEERRVPLFQGDYKRQLLSYTPAGKVPAYIDGNLRIWDSLAILEHLAEKHPHTQGWPRESAARALARTVSAEMHSGFPAMRETLAMNLRHGHKKPWSDEVKADIERITAIWEDCRARSRAQGDFLFGAFGIADAMYAPVAFRFQTYGVDLPPAARSYCDTLLALPAMKAWLEDARREAEVITRYEQ
jgi:glutathione S-transferase